METPVEGESRVQVDDADAIRADWLTRLDALAARVKGWVESSGWRTRLVSKPTRDPLLGRYEVPLLLMERDGVEVALNPVSRFVPDADGAVDLYVTPAYDEFAGLYFVNGWWEISYAFRRASGVREPESMPLSEETFLRVLDDLAIHVA